MKYGSLFSGIGGFDLAFEQAGMECAWQVEIDKDCQKILNDHWIDVEKYADVKTVGGRNLAAVDLICGGFPCQDLSVAGRREGLAGERSGLWFEFHRIIAELKPQWVVIENVPGLLSSNGGKDFAIILRGLVECGYGVCWRVLDAQYFGVAQRRRRVFIVGSLGDGRAAQVLFEREGGAGNPPARREAGQGIANGSPTSTLRGFGHGWQGQHNDTNPVIVSRALSASPTATGGLDHDYIDYIVAGTLDKKSTSGDRGSQSNEHEFIVPVAWHNKQQSVGIRRLTPVECERLQGFPDGWTAGQSDSIRYRQLGNAVAVPVVKWIGERIAAQKRGHKSDLILRKTNK